MMPILVGHEEGFSNLVFGGISLEHDDVPMRGGFVCFRMIFVV